MTAVRQLPFWLFGVGGVGGRLMRILNDDDVRERLHVRTGLEFRPILLADTRGYLLDPRGIDRHVVEEVLAHKESGGSVLAVPNARPLQAAEAVLTALERQVALRDTIGVDATASEEMVSVLGRALDQGAGVVLANKRPLTASWAEFQDLTRTPRCRHEATVGAGLPVIGTLRSLLDSGDVVTHIEGCFSGTLGYICSALNRGEAYSRAVVKAVELGYAEPDPREDLSGLDVARKALILSRMLGRPYELSDLHVEPMIPDRLQGLDLATFMRRLSEADEEMADRVRQAGRAGQKLAYVAELSPDGVPRISLRSVDPDSAVGRLGGTDNIVVYRTHRYADTPLVIQGPGAGRSVTAGGVLTDMIALGARQTYE